MSYLGFLSTSSQLCHSLVSVMQRAFDRLLICPTTSTQVRWLPIFPYIPCKASCESTKARRLISYVWGAGGEGVSSQTLLCNYHAFLSLRFRSSTLPHCQRREEISSFHQSARKPRFLFSSLVSRMMEKQK